MEIDLALKESWKGDKSKLRFRSTGKYHRTMCLECNYIAEEPPPILICPNCGSRNVVKGVKDRITEIQDRKPGLKRRINKYFYQIPLEFIPGVGPKTITHLLDCFHTEMNILHKVSKTDLEQAVGGKLAHNIILARMVSLVWFQVVVVYMEK